jgi:ankyrin repeat protein
MENFVKFLPLIIVALLLFVAKEGYSIFKYAKQGRLHEAARSGRLDRVQEFLQAGYPVNAIDPRFGLTPLHVAVRNGHIEIAKLLLGNGAGFDDPSAQGITPRQWASQYLSPEACDELQRLSAEMQEKQDRLSRPTL